MPFTPPPPSPSSLSEAVDLLDPKLDVVFKLLFAEPRNRRLLLSLLTAVLRPTSPIEEVTVLDPELPKDFSTDRGVRLDLLVGHADGTRSNIEMECDPRRAHPDRWLYHWARLYADGLRRGEAYALLEPVICIVFLGCRADAQRFHATYELREVHELSALTGALQLHIVSLPHLERAPAEGEEATLERWARFLRFESPQALECLAKEDPIMAEAKSALEILSLEPSARRLAEMRRQAEIERRLDRAQDLAEGEAIGIAKGEARGEERGAAIGVATAVLRIFATRGLAVSEEQRERVLSCADAATLTRWIERAVTAASTAEALSEACAHPSR